MLANIIVTVVCWRFLTGKVYIVGGSNNMDSAMDSAVHITQSDVIPRFSFDSIKAAVQLEWK